MADNARVKRLVLKYADKIQQIISRDGYIKHRINFFNDPVEYDEMIILSKYFRYLGYATFPEDNCFGYYSLCISGRGIPRRGLLGWWYAKRLKKLQAQLGI